jgi:hypothetical protein
MGVAHSRTAVLFSTLLLAVLSARAGRAMAESGPRPLVLDVLSDAGLDVAVLREQVAAELGVRVVAPGDPAARATQDVVRIDLDKGKNEILVELSRPGANPLERRLRLPIQSAVLQRTLVFLVGNMVRDESRDLIPPPRTQGGAVAEAPPAASPDTRPQGETAAGQSQAASPDTRPSEPPPPSAEGPSPPRYWFGVSVEGAIGGMPATADACRRDLTTSLTTSGLSCVTQDGHDYAVTMASSHGSSPSGGPPSSAGDVGGGLAVASTRFALSFDYALHDNWLVGTRLGFAIARYPGRDPGLHGRTWGPAHLELRGTYVLGNRALAQPGVHAAISLAAGVSEWDARVGISVSAGTPPSTFPVDVWRIVAGPFVSAGLGARVSIGARGAVMLNLAKVTAAAGSISGTDAVLLYSPELGVEVGF